MKRTLVLVALGALIAVQSWVVFSKALDEQVQAAYDRGWREALSTREPVNDDLEMACLRLWFNELNAEAARRQSL